MSDYKPTASDMSEEHYLGDGLYASFDGFLVKLRAPRDNGDHWVALDPMMVAELLDFLANRFEPNDALKAAAARYRRNQKS